MMKLNFKPFHVVFALLLLFMLFGFADVALAQANNSAAQAGPQASQLCKGSPSGNQFTTYIVNCVKNALINTTTQYLRAFSDFMKPIIRIALILSLTLFGVKMLMGDNKLSTKSIGLLLKIGVIWWLTDDFGGMMPAVFGGMEDLQQMVTGSLVEPSANCPVTGNTPNIVWQRIDCITGRMFGFGPEAMLASSIMGIVGASIFSGTVGVQLFMTGVSAMIMILMSIFRAVYGFLMSYAAIAFLILISPLIIPMLAFNVTSKFFYQWLTQVISSMFEPVIMFGFLSLFFVLMEQIIFGGGNSSLPSLNQVLADLPSGFRTAVPVISSGTTADPATQAGTGELSAMSGTMSPLLGKTTELFSFLRVPTLDFGGQQVAKMYKMVSATLSITIVSYLMMTMLEHIPTLARQMVGLGSYVSPGAAGGKMPGEQAFNQKMDEGVKKWEQQTKGSGGGYQGLSSFILRKN